MGKVAIVCPGKGWRIDWDAAKGDGWEATVGVGRACWDVDFEWMAWMDAMHIRRMIERGREPLIGSVWHVSDFKWCESEKVYEAYPMFDNGRRAPYTVCNAVNWALGKWEDAEIHLIGARQSLMHPVRKATENVWIMRAIAENGAGGRLIW